MSERTVVAGRVVDAVIETAVVSCVDMMLQYSALPQKAVIPRMNVFLELVLCRIVGG